MHITIVALLLGDIAVNKLINPVGWVPTIEQTKNNQLSQVKN